MEKFLKSKNTIILTVIFLILLSILSILSFKFNLGSFFYSSTVLVLEMDEPRSTDNVAMEISKLRGYSSIEKEGDNKFYIFFQNLNEEDKVRINESLSNIFPMTSSQKYYSYQPAREQIILTRSIYIFAIFLIIGFIFYSTQLKNIGLIRREVIDFLFTEGLLFGCSLLILGGYISLLGGLGFLMDPSFFVFTLISIFLIIIFFMYYLFRFKDEVIRFQEYDHEVIEKNIIKNNWPEFLFLLSISFILLFIPCLVISFNIAISSTQVLISVLLSGYTFFFVRKLILHISLFENKLLNKFSKAKFLIKKW